MKEKFATLQNFIKECTPTYDKKLWEDANEYHYGYRLTDYLYEGAYLTTTLGIAFTGTYLCLNGNWSVGLVTTALGTGMGALFFHLETSF